MALSTLKLSDIQPDQVDNAQRTAVLRLQLFVTGEVHRLVGEVQEAGAKVLRGGSSEKAVSGAIATLALQAYLKKWNSVLSDITQLIAAGIRVAASLPYGALAILHEELIRPNVTELVEEPKIDPRGNTPVTVQVNQPFPTWTNSLAQLPGRLLTEALNPDVVFEPQLLGILEGVYERVYGDGFKLSDRIWRLDNQTRQQIQATIALGMQQQVSAWELAQRMEQYLGPGQGCPRWTRDRLNSLTKKDIAGGDMTGFISGDECAGQGVAYNALRLARTEIQYAFNAATDKMFAAMPWITQEQINLSAEHADTDICDGIAGGGEGAKGIYPKGTVILPLHPHCLCFKTAVLMDEKEFMSKLKGWMTGASSWQAMDEYAGFVGGDVTASLLQTGIGVSLAYWLWGDSVSLGNLFWGIATGRLG